MPSPKDHRDQSPAPSSVGTVRRRLIIRPGAIGDTILSLPAIESLRAPETEIWVPTANLPLVANLGASCSIASTGIDLLEWPAALIARFRTFDDIVSWYGAAREDLRERTHALGLPFRFLRALPPPEWTGHAADFFLSQVGLPSGASPRLPVDRRDEGFAVIHPFSGSPRKNWPLDNFRAVARALETRLPVHWCAGPDEPLEGAVRFETLDLLAAWLARASLFIGNDSGIAHLAAACGVPVVAVFGPTSPELWAPRGPAVSIWRFEDSPAKVISAAESLLSLRQTT